MAFLGLTVLWLHLLELFAGQLDAQVPSKMLIVMHQHLPGLFLVLASA